MGLNLCLSHFPFAWSSSFHSGLERHSLFNFPIVGDKTHKDLSAKSIANAPKQVVACAWLKVGGNTSISRKAIRLAFAFHYMRCCASEATNVFIQC